MPTCIKQHLSNIWGSIQEKGKQHWGWVEKKAMLIKKCVTFDYVVCLTLVFLRGFSFKIH